MSADPRAACPVCDVLVDELEDLEPDGVRVARPCGHLVAITGVLPGGRLELGIPANPKCAHPGCTSSARDDDVHCRDHAEISPPGTDDAPAEGLREAVRRWTRPAFRAAHDEHPLTAQLRGQTGGMIEAMIAAMTDAQVLGTGWIRFQAPPEGGPPLPVRIDPSLIIVVEPSTGAEQ